MPIERVLRARARPSRIEAIGLLAKMSERASFRTRRPWSARTSGGKPGADTHGYDAASDD